MTALWADPRGAYAILALLALSVLGASMAPGGLRDRTRRASRIVAGTVLVGAALSLVWPELMRTGALDTNPAIAYVDLGGTWGDGRDTLQLRPDGRYECAGPRCTGFGTHGTWRRGATASIVARWTDGHEVVWRVVTYRGSYRLALLSEGDANVPWEGRLFYERVGP